ncbi:MAG: glycosyltransferase [Coriobacteriia bacterium]|nr:glycosyltransferase [Coriobacteriia bacterium]
MRDLSRIAVIDHVSHGGVSRFLLALITHMAAMHPELTLVYYVSQTNIERDDLESKLAPIPNVTLRSIPSPIQPPQEPGLPQPGRESLWKATAAVLKAVPPLHKVLLGMLVFVKNLKTPPPPAWWEYRMPDDVVAELGEFDVAYFGWPYYTEPVSFPTATVATFHDFHYKHFPESYSTGQLRILDADTTEWLRRCRTAVTSTHFIHDELLGYFPQVSVPVEIVYLASYGFHHPVEGAVEEAVERFGIKRPFALYSGGCSGHKNVARILEAVGILKQQGAPVHLVISGAGTDAIGLTATEPTMDSVRVMNEAIERYGLVRGEDYHPLGYVSNADVDALTAGADLVVSASMYEAGCGPAMDAWLAGVPVAFSNIPPFIEQTERFGVQAWIFDPLDSADIADKMRAGIHETARSAEMVAASLHAFERYGWDDVAREYYRIFAEAAEAGPTERMLTPAPSRRRFWFRRTLRGWMA